MKRKHVTDVWLTGERGHIAYDFVDVAVNDDNLLFIDPCLMEALDNEWGKQAVKTMKSYFDCLYEAYETEDKRSKYELFSHVGEQNGTRLGYGAGHNGKGHTADGMLDVLRPLETLIHEIKTIGVVQDLAILVPGFAEDGMSDLLTNVLHDLLHDFTMEQMKKYGVRSNGITSYHFWNAEAKEWQWTQKAGYLVDGRELLVVPKGIVRKNYLFGTGQYFARVIIERIRAAGGMIDNDGKLIPKKDIIKSYRHSEDHWMYNKVIDYSKQNEDALEEYHDRVAFFYRESGGTMTDEELDATLYGVKRRKSA